MSAKPAIVSLISYRLHKLLLENLPDHEGEPSITVESGLAKTDDDSETYALRLVIRTSPPAPNETACVPRIEVDIEGFFRTIMDGEPEEIDKAVRVYGGAQLYSLVRGLISAPAAMFTPTTTVLPSLNMLSVMDRAKPLKKRRATKVESAKRKD